MKKKPPQRAGKPHKTPSQQWEDLIVQWLYNRPEGTQQEYNRGVRRFLLFVKYRSIHQIELTDLQNYSRTLSRYKPRTQAQRLAAVKSLFSFATKIGVLQFDPARALVIPKIPTNLADKILDESQILEMIRQEPNKRNRVLLIVLYGAGIRATEASGLRWLDVQKREKGGQITVIGKGSKTRSIVVSEATWKALQSIKPENIHEESPVFRNRDGGPLNRITITNLVRDAARRVGIERNVSAHWMRHGHATHALDRKVPITIISKTLGHTSLETTAKYLHARPEESSATHLAV